MNSMKPIKVKDIAYLVNIHENIQFKNLLCVIHLPSTEWLDVLQSGPHPSKAHLGHRSGVVTCHSSTLVFRRPGISGTAAASETLNSCYLAILMF